MMYANKLAAAVKVDGRVLREVDDCVFIPYGTEYSITLKNLNVLRAIVNIEIDGKNVSGGGLVIDAGKSINLERFIENGNLSGGQRFKFIERTAKIEAGPRGIGVEDGIIRIRFAFDATPVYTRPAYNMLRSRSLGDASEATFSTSARSFSPASITKSASAKNDIGITVGGSLSNQQFVEVDDFRTGPEEVLIFRVFGDTGRGVVQEAVTVKTKLECPTCGTKSKVGAKFCPECGTGLLVA